jgi:hypothetical protein
VITAVSYAGGSLSRSAVCHGRRDAVGDRVRPLCGGLRFAAPCAAEEGARSVIASVSYAVGLRLAASCATEEGVRSRVSSSLQVGPGDLVCR